MHTSVANNQILTALERVSIHGTLGKFHSEEDVRLLVAVGQLISFEHEYGVGQVVEDLNQRVSCLLCCLLQDEKRG